MTQYLIEQNFEFVPKKKNLPNLPQARPIEQFWAICKQRYPAHNKIPKNLIGFKRIWKKKMQMKLLKNMDGTWLQNA